MPRPKPKSSPAAKLKAGLLRRIVVVGKKVQLDETNTLEAKVLDLALGGQLKGAGNTAVRVQIARGLPVVFQEKQKIIKQFPDGTRRTIGTVKPIAFQVPRHVRVLGRMPMPEDDVSSEP